MQTVSKSWSSIRKRFEHNLLCEKLRGRVQYFRTIYHGAPDEYGRFAVRVDGEEIFQANPYNVNNYSSIAWDIKQEREIPPREWTGKEDLHDAENLEAEEEARMIADAERNRRYCVRSAGVAAAVLPAQAGCGRNHNALTSLDELFC